MNQVTSRTFTPEGQTDVSFNVGYSYVAAGIFTMTYPSMRQVKYDYDSAGRVSAVTGVATGSSGSSAKVNYATDLKYASHGGLREVTYDNSLVEQRTYSTSLQPRTITVGTTRGTTDTGSNRLKLEYSYCVNLATADCGGNNGDVTIQKMDSAATQVYSYDGVNRLSR